MTRVIRSVNLKTPRSKDGIDVFPARASANIVLGHSVANVFLVARFRRRLHPPFQRDEGHRRRLYRPSIGQTRRLNILSAIVTE